MNEFFRVWDIARKLYNLERIVHSDLEEISIKIYLDGKVIVRADGPTEDLEYIYFSAARRLITWLEYREKDEN